MEISILNNELMGVKESLQKDIEVSLGCIYKEELLKLNNKDDISNLLITLKRKERKLLSTYIESLPEKCRKPLLEAFVKSGLPQSRTAMVWHSIKQKIDIPRYSSVNIDTAKYESSQTKENVKIINTSIKKNATPAVTKMFVGGVLGLVAVAAGGYLIYSPIQTAYKVLLGLGSATAIGIAAACIVSTKTTTSYTEISVPTGYSFQKLLDEQYKINKDKLFAYVNSVVDTALEVGKEYK